MRISDWSSDVCSSDLPLFCKLASELVLGVNSPAIRENRVAVSQVQYQAGCPSSGMLQTNFSRRTNCQLSDYFWHWCAPGRRRVCEQVLGCRQGVLCAQPHLGQSHPYHAAFWV